MSSVSLWHTWGRGLQPGKRPPQVTRLPFSEVFKSRVGSLSPTDYITQHCTHTLSPVPKSVCLLHCCPSLSPGCPLFTPSPWSLPSPLASLPIQAHPRYPSSRKPTQILSLPFSPSSELLQHFSRLLLGHKHSFPFITFVCQT